MSTPLNLTNPKVDRALRNALIAASVVCLVWTGLTAVETSSARAAVSSKSSQLEIEKSQMDTADITYRARLRASKRVGDVPQAAPYAGTAQFATDADALAHRSGAMLTGIQFNTRNGANTFQCTVVGSFPALLRVVDAFSQAASGVKIDTADLARGRADRTSGLSPVTMHISGELN